MAWTSYDDGVGYDAAIPYDGQSSGKVPKAYGADTRLLNYILIEEARRRSLLDGSTVRHEQLQVAQLVNRVANQWAAFEMEMARQKDNMIFAALLAEV